MTVHHHLVDVIARNVVQTLIHRDSGHCLQVPYLPRELADDVAERVYRDLVAPDGVALVQSDPTALWHAKPTKIVELRNAVEATGGRLVIFLVAGQHVAAEDSFGESTFEIYDLQAVYPQLVDDLLQRLEEQDPNVGQLARGIIDVACADARFGVTDSRVASFLSALVDEPTIVGVGWSMPELGLLPDSGIDTGLGHDLKIRLERNRQHVALLTNALPPAERVRSLSIDRTKPVGKRLAAEILAQLTDGSRTP